eukprot:361636-Chlamydomonas_euryale.AAC.1
MARGQDRQTVKAVPDSCHDHCQAWAFMRPRSVQSRHVAASMSVCSASGSAPSLAGGVSAPKAFMPACNAARADEQACLVRAACCLHRVLQ